MLIYWMKTNTITRNTEPLLVARREVGLEINTQKAKYMVVSRHQNVGQNHNLQISSKLFEYVAKFKYLRTTVINVNCNHEEIKSRFFSRFVSKNIEIKIQKTIILPVVSYGCETWYCTQREEHRLRVFEKRALRRIFGPKREGVA
jgi:hypothetical protein